MAFSLRPLPRYAGLDAAAVTVLTVATLASLWTTFTGYDWMIAGGAGLAIGLGWAYLFWSLRLNFMLVALTIFIPYVLTAGGIALRRWGLFLGFPDARSVELVVKGSYSGWTQLLETVPLVDSRGTVMLVPFALGMACGALGGGLAVHSRRAAWPVVVFVALLVLVLFLGTPVPLAVAAQGLGFGVVALWWIGHRTARNQTGRGGRESQRRVGWGRTAAAAAVVAVAAGVVAPLAASSSDRPRWVLREVITPIDSEPVTTPLTVFRSFRPGHDADFAREPVFAVSGVEPGTTLRIAVLDGYDGERWYARRDASEHDFRDRFLRVSSRIDNPSRGKLVNTKVSVVAPWRLDWLPIVGRVQSFEFMADRESYQRDQIRYNRSTNTALMLGGVLMGDEYTMETKVASERLAATMNPWPEPDAQLQQEAAFLDLPARAWSVGQKRPMDQLFQIAAKLRERGRYSDGDPGWQARFTDGHDAEKLMEGFLAAPQMVGNDEQYAAAMALLANRIGIPARVVVGASVGKDGNVRGRDIGAWVEVRIADGSWRTLPTATFMSHRPPTPTDPQLPPIKIPKPPRPDKEQQQQEQQQKEEEEQRQREEEREQSGPSPLWLLLLAPPLLVGAVPTLKVLRRRRRLSGEPGELALGGWAEIVDTAADLGLRLPVRPRPDQARALAVDVRLARMADVASFTDQKPTLDAGYRAAVLGTRKQLAEGAPGWRRLLAPVNPVSLVRRGPR